MSNKISLINKLVDLERISFREYFTVSILKKFRLSMK